MTELSKQRPREFWIEKFNGRRPPSFYAFKDKPDFNKLMLKIDDAEVKACEYFHVIEASYAKELEAEIERLKADLEFSNDVVKERENWAAMRLKTCKKLEHKNDALTEKLAVAVNALQFYENTTRLMLDVRDLKNPIYLSTAIMDNGDTARKALKEIE